MNAFSDRLAQARIALKISQRELAKRLGARQGTYSSWELGKTSPKASILEGLCALGIDGHWLLTGEGTPLKESRNNVAPQVSDELWSHRRTGNIGKEGFEIYTDPQERNELTLQEELRNLRETGLDRLFLLSQRGSQAGLWRVIKALGRPDLQLSLKQLHATISIDGEPVPELSHVLADCQLLVMQGIITEMIVGDEPKYALASNARLRPNSHVEQLQAVREAVRSIGTKILPAIRRRNHTGWLYNAEVWVPSGAEFIAKLRELIHSELTKAHDKGERVYLLMAAGLEANTEDDKPWWTG